MFHSNVTDWEDLLNFFSSCTLASTIMQIPLNGVNLKSRVITVLYLETKTEKNMKNNFLNSRFIELLNM